MVSFPHRRTSGIPPYMYVQPNQLILNNNLLPPSIFNLIASLYNWRVQGSHVNHKRYIVSFQRYLTCAANEQHIESIWAASPSTTRGQPTQLSSDAKGERLAYAVCNGFFSFGLIVYYGRIY